MASKRHSVNAGRFEREVEEMIIDPMRGRINQGPCARCGELPTTLEGHDHCLGTLPWVMNACCGHGEADSAYVQFSSLLRVSGGTALFTIRLLKAIRRKRAAKL